MIMLTMLCIASLVVFRGIMKRCETTLVIGVMLYAGAVTYIAAHAPELVMPSILLGIAAGVVGLVRILLIRIAERGRRTSELSEYFSDN